MVLKTTLCRFSGLRIWPGRGMLFIRTDNQQYLFLNKKCKSLYHNRLRPAKLAWTTTYRCGGCLGARGQMGVCSKCRGSNCSGCLRATGWGLSSLSLGSLGPLVLVGLQVQQSSTAAAAAAVHVGVHGSLWSQVSSGCCGRLRQRVVCALPGLLAASTGVPHVQGTAFGAARAKFDAVGGSSGCRGC
jgi:large subunit ribosomal protein L24e